MTAPRISKSKSSVVGVVETVFAMWFSGEWTEGMRRGVKYKENSNTTVHNLTYAVKTHTEQNTACI